jgi:hypothetical protein
VASEQWNLGNIHGSTQYLHNISTILERLSDKVYETCKWFVEGIMDQKSLLRGFILLAREFMDVI